MRTKRVISGKKNIIPSSFSTRKDVRNSNQTKNNLDDLFVDHEVHNDTAQYFV